MENGKIGGGEGLDVLESNGRKRDREIGREVWKRADK